MTVDFDPVDDFIAFREVGGLGANDGDVGTGGVQGARLLPNAPIKRER